MAWAKLDDQFHRHPKALKAWQTEPRAIALWVMTLSWAASNTDTDSVPEGFVSADYVAMLVPNAKQRENTTRTLVDVGLWETVDGGWLFHDYLDRNQSREEYRANREKTRERVRWHRNQGADDNATVTPLHRRNPGTGTGTGVNAIGKKVQAK
jgi:hypothetical protein